MKFYSILLTLFLTIDCSSSASPEKGVSVSSNNSQTSVSNNLQPTETPINLNSNSSNTPTSIVKESSETEVKEPSDKDDFTVKIVTDEKTNTQNVHIIVGNEAKWIIKMPGFEDINNFGVDKAIKNKNGFEFEVEYGSRYKYDKTFYFIKKDANFYLTQIKVKSFDGNNPQKWSEKTVKVNPKVSLDKFEMKKYLSD